MNLRIFNNISIAVCLGSALISVSCVSTKKFEDVQSKYEFLLEENLNLKKVKRESNELIVKNQELTEELQSNKDLLKSTSSNYTGIQSSYEELQSQYDLLSDQNKKLLLSTAGEKSTLEKEIALKQDQLDSKLREVLAQKESLDLQKKDQAVLVEELKIREAQINELNVELKTQKEILSNLKSTISKALSSFNADELQIEQKENGKVYISLSQKLLFQKGSNKIDEKGKVALNKLAKVLISNEDFEILVEGHTDTDGSSSRNWDLSVTRATEVVKILQLAGLKPEKLIASGKAFYAPIAENDSEENKAKNRRTEIIISPNLNALFKLINEQ